MTFPMIVNALDGLDPKGGRGGGAGSGRVKVDSIAAALAASASIRERKAMGV